MTAPPAPPTPAEQAPIDTSTAIAVDNLSKVYRSARRRVVAVDNLSMHVPRHGVHGFLGPNGSGKTTTIRMLLGLVHANAGQMHLLGRRVPDQLPEVISQVGAIVESPKFFPTFTARQNLKLAAETIGAPPASVDEVLEQVGLTARRNDRYRTYSLGMKQRLAIASTLLKNPDVLIFDEPTNGLDPQGIQEIRETIRHLGSSGRCVLVSSHILSEVQVVADTVSIIGRGRLLAEGSVAELMSGTSTVRVRVADADRARRVLAASGFTARPDSGALLVDDSPDPARINETLAREGLFASELVAVHRDLEQVFLELTRGEAPNTPASTGFSPTTGPGQTSSPVDTSGGAR